MAQSPEIELIDQLSGSDMPLPLMMDLFASEAAARRAIALYLEKGVISLLEKGEPVPEWRALAVLRDVGGAELHAGSWQLSLTRGGAGAFESGEWPKI